MFVRPTVLHFFTDYITFGSWNKPTLLHLSGQQYWVFVLTILSLSCIQYCFFVWRTILHLSGLQYCIFILSFSLQPWNVIIYQNLALSEITLLHLSRLQYCFFIFEILCAIQTIFKKHRNLYLVWGPRNEHFSGLQYCVCPAYSIAPTVLALSEISKHGLLCCVCLAYSIAFLKWTKKICLAYSIAFFYFQNTVRWTNHFWNT